MTDKEEFEEGVENEEEPEGGCEVANAQIVLERAWGYMKRVMISWGYMERVMISY